MPLQGSLGHLGLADLLQTGLAGRTGGYLTLRRGAEHAVLYVADDGLYLLSPDPLDPSEVVGAFAKRGMASSAAADKIRKQDSKQARQHLDALLDGGALPETAFLELLAGTAEDIILDLLTWEDGSFRFEERALDPRHVGLVGRIGVDPGGVLLRAAQRMDERYAIARDLGLQSTLFVALASSRVPEDEDNPHIAEVHGALDGQTLVTEAALLLGIGRFTALRSVHALVQAGAARTADAEELRTLALARLEEQKYGAARSLALHWAGVEPTNAEPIELLIQVASGLGRFDEEISARCALGNLLLHTNRGEDAVRAFQAALDRAPNQEDALAGMRIAAQAIGDQRAYARATLTLAQASLDGDDEERAARLGDDLCRADPKNVEAHVLRARAMVRSGNRDGFIESAEAVGALLGRRARRKQDREAACYFRDALTSVAPERGDLHRRYRALNEGSSRSYRRVALMVALLGILGTAGVVLWPASPQSILADAEAAFERGERTHARQLVANLIERFPDSPEAETAFQLQIRMIQPTRQVVPASTTAKTADAAADEVFQTLERTLARLPEIESVIALAEFVERLEGPTSKPDRKRLFKQHGLALPETARRLQRQARAREDLIAQTKSAFHQLDGDAPALETFLKRANIARDEEYAKRLEASATLLERIGRMRAYDTMRAALFGLREAVDRHARAILTYKPSFVACEQALSRMHVDSLFERCTTEAPALLVGGRLDEADGLYKDLETFIQTVQDSPNLGPVRQRVERLRIGRFLRDRRGTIAGIKRDLKAAQAAEEEDDLEAAGQIYAGLVKRHWQIRFENVFTMPLQVDSVPIGASVSVNGKVVGTTPLRVRYPWGSQTTIVLDADGYASRTTVVAGGGDDPDTHLDIRLLLTASWSADVGHAVRARPTAVGEHVLVVDRSGRVTLHDGTTGSALWSRHYKNIEGIRAQPVVSSDDVVIGYVDGRVLFLSRQDGAIRNDLRLDRLVGDLAVHNDVVAAVTHDGEFVTLRQGRVLRRIALGVTPTAGIIAAHGAYWIGSTDGTIIRLDATTLRTRRTRVPGAAGSLTGLAADATGVLGTCSDGRLLAIDRAGSLRWSKAGLGDLVGAPAEASGVVAVADRRGRISLFEARTGAPKGVKSLGGEPQGGLTAQGTNLLVGLADGRFWVYAPASNTVRVDAPLGGSPRFRPAALGGHRVALSLGDGRMTVARLHP